MINCIRYFIFISENLETQEVFKQIFYFLDFDIKRNVYISGSPLVVVRKKMLVAVVVVGQLRGWQTISTGLIYSSASLEKEVLSMVDCKIYQTLRIYTRRNYIEINRCLKRILQYHYLQLYPSKVLPMISPKLPHENRWS